MWIPTSLSLIFVSCRSRVWYAGISCSSFAFGRRHSIIAIDTVIQKLGYHDVSRLRQQLERAYFTISLPFPVDMTRVSAVGETGIDWKDEGSGGVGESEQAEGRSTDAQ